LGRVLVWPIVGFRSEAVSFLTGWSAMQFVESEV
jgi:hypothetical protein